MLTMRKYSGQVPCADHSPEDSHLHRIITMRTGPGATRTRVLSHYVKILPVRHGKIETNVILTFVILSPFAEMIIISLKLIATVIPADLKTEE